MAIVSALAVLLTACAPLWPSADWSGSRYISKTETLQFVALADCTVPWPFNPVTGDYFFEVSALRQAPGEAWRYFIQYQGSTGSTAGLFDITQWWTAAKTGAGPTHANDANRRCGVLIDIPQSATSHRPYYVEDARTKGIEHDWAVGVEIIVLSPMCVFFVLLLVPASFGFESSETWWVAAAAAFAIVLVSLTGTEFCIGAPWRAFEKAQAYWAWFDALPHADGRLLPIPADNFWFLLHGPPNDTEFHAGAWAIATILLAEVWLGAVMPAVVTGWYWIRTPLPLEKINRRALAEGRAPTVEELDAALHAALAGKEAWQIDVMRRKADAFARRFGHVRRR
jgi:hypothetical protein